MVMNGQLKVALRILREQLAYVWLAMFTDITTHSREMSVRVRSIKIYKSIM